MENKALITDPGKRHDFLLLFDVTDGNPNGDPDAGNLPRVDPETMQGLVTDVCIKRKVRNWVAANKGTEARYKIYVEHKGILNLQHKRAYEERELESTGTKQDRETIESGRSWMCDNFYDIRTFGAVMTTGVNCGQVRGPVQFTFARSIDPIVPMDLSLTRVAVTRIGDALGSSKSEEALLEKAGEIMKSLRESGEESESGGGKSFSEKVIQELVQQELENIRKNTSEGEDDEEAGAGKVTEMGRKAIVPYGLYRGQGFVNPHFAHDTGLDQDDLSLLWEALQKMWDLDRSSSRGMMGCRGLYIFTHENPLGNAPAHKLFERLSISKIEEERVPRKFTDYQVQLDDQDLPDGITLTAIT